jgi:hypothetical protein
MRDRSERLRDLEVRKFHEGARQADLKNRQKKDEELKFFKRKEEDESKPIMYWLELR